MKLTGHVINGKIEVEGNETLPEGALVNITISDQEGQYELTADEEAELWKADQEIERGEFVTAEALLAQLRSSRGRQ